ncbi:MAG: DnaA/Hda family protein [Parasphingorhabdus sp.]|nr:DnaA/Hda family protein [Parasphingorhabdus sp.]
MSQIALPLEIASAASDDAYIITAANRAAHARLQASSDWANRAAILIGAPGSGKSTMLRQFVASTSGVTVDDADRAAQDALFHSWNRARDEKRPLLLAATLLPGEWTLTLPDLRSRLATAEIITIDAPDDAMVEALLSKLLIARGLAPSVEIIAYLARRVERHYAAIAATARTLDRMAAEKKRPLTIGLARALFDSDTQSELPWDDQYG